MDPERSRLGPVGLAFFALREAYLTEERELSTGSDQGEALARESRRLRLRGYVPK
jgi:hypothetical protein